MASPDGSPADGSQPATLGPYRIDRLVGRGGMGEVYRAWDERRRRWVALKVLDRWTAHDPAYRRRFRREAETAARLTDPHVLAVHDYGEIDGRLYLDMRLVDGPDLAALLADGPLPPARALGLLGQVAEALDAAHAAGLVHRDVKPSNVLVASGDFAYVVDFGLARDQTDVSSEEPAELLGTLGYMAPERLRGERADRRADVYSLACMVVECLTGRRPYGSSGGGEDPAAVIAGHLHGPPPRLHDRDPSLPPALDAVIARGLATDPDDRHPDAGALIRAVAGAFAIERPAGPPPPHPPPPPPREPPPDPPPTRRGPPPGLARTPRPRRPRTRGRLAALVGGGLVVVVLLVIGVAVVRDYVGDGLAIGLSPIAVAPAPDGDRVLVVGGGAEAVTVVDTRQQAVTQRIPLGTRAIAAAVDGDQLEIVTVDGLVTLDLGTVAVVGTVRLPAPAIGPPAVSSRAAIPSSTGIEIVDPGTGAREATADRPARVVAISRDGARVFALDQRGTTLGVVDARDGRVVGETPLGAVGRDLAVEPGGRWLAVIDDAPALSIVDIATGRVEQRIPLPGRPSGLAITPDGTRVLVGTDRTDEADTPAVVAVDRASGRVVATYRREPHARTVALAVSPDGSRLYVANTDLGTLTVDALRR